MKSFMLIAAVVICFGSVVNAVPVQVKFTGYVEDNYLTPAGSEYFGVLPGDEFICILTYDPEAITYRPTVNTNPLDDHFIHLAPMGEVGISLAVDSPSQYLVQTDPVAGSYYMHVTDSTASSNPGRVNVWATGLSPGSTSISMGLYEQDYQVVLNGSTFPEIHLERLLRGRFAVRSQGFRFQCTITGSELFEEVPPPAPTYQVKLRMNPGEGDNRGRIQLGAQGHIMAALFGSEHMDLVTMIEDPGATIMFDLANDVAVTGGATPVEWAVGDVDLDGFDDILMKFARTDLAQYLTVDTTQVGVVGGTTDGGLFVGAALVSPFLPPAKVKVKKDKHADHDHDKKGHGHNDDKHGKKK